MISFCSSTQHWLCKSVWNSIFSPQRSAVSPASSDGEVDLWRNFIPLGRWGESGTGFQWQGGTISSGPEFGALGSEPVLAASGLV